MTDESPSPTETLPAPRTIRVAPAREPPPSGRQVALVLVGLTVAMVVFFTLACLGYAVFIDHKAR